MALTDEESNTNEEQNVTFATGNGKLLFYNCLSRPIHFKVEKVHIPLNIIFCNRLSWKNREYWGRKALTYLHLVLNFLVSVIIRTICIPVTFPRLVSV